MVQISKTHCGVGVVSLFVGATIAYTFSRTKLSPAFMAFGLAPPAIAAALFAVKRTEKKFTISDLPSNEVFVRRPNEGNQTWVERITEVFGGLPGVDPDGLDRVGDRLIDHMDLASSFWDERESLILFFTACNGIEFSTNLANFAQKESGDLLQFVRRNNDEVLKDLLEDRKGIDPTFSLSGKRRLQYREAQYLYHLGKPEAKVFLFGCQHPELSDSILDLAQRFSETGSLERWISGSSKEFEQRVTDEVTAFIRAQHSAAQASFELRLDSPLDLRDQVEFFKVTAYLATKGIGSSDTDNGLQTALLAARQSLYNRRCYPYLGGEFERTSGTIPLTQWIDVLTESDETLIDALRSLTQI